MAQATKSKSKKAGTTKGLEKKLWALNEMKKRTEQQMAGWRNEVAELNKLLAAAERSDRAFEREIDEMTNRIFVRGAVTPAFAAARKAFIEKSEHSRSDRITVAKQKALRGEVEKDKLALQGLCTHPFVFSYDGYGGSRSMDNDDQYPGHRVCALCNLHETSEGTSEDIYKILDEDGTHLVLRDLREKKNLPKSFEEEWFTLEFLRELFEKSAGDRNVAWPPVIIEL